MTTPWPTVWVAFALLSSSAGAQTVTLSGYLDDGEAPADGLFSFAFALREVDDDASEPLWSEEQPAVVVADGVFAVDVGAARPLPSTVPATARLFVTIDDDALPPLSLARLARASSAAFVDEADRAFVARAWRGRPLEALATTAALGAAGGPPVAFAAVTGVPPALADGDDGVVVAATAGGLVLDGGLLALAAVPGDRLADGSVTGAHLPAGAVQGRHVVDSSLGGAQVAAGAITRATLAAPLTARELRTTPVFRVDASVCTMPRDSLTRQESCQPNPCVAAPATPGAFSCDGATCITAAPRCPNKLVGSVVLP